MHRTDRHLRLAHSSFLFKRQRGRVAWFIVVGCAAAAVHWSVATACVALGGLAPLQANVAGWLVAFAVSFSGHHFLSFRGHGNGMGRAALRFFAISAGGFAINEAAYALLLHWTRARYDILLAIVLVGVAGLTYLLSRHWAFLRTQ
ncbi:MAG: sugar translocase [Comamonadaceae bacterium SCN 68-20]|jgi:putative flippase GtrA|nr:GtrA family protein [Comamonadaceae bacterium]MBN9365650.1 GtrA family protein [Comamonadaceae bacterium]ODU60754.1 MAG: sugar translocase [Comamonadaceae bacterium SCN 68-20]OJX28213.1 MAG: sugar translocase [Burkholderiales bacterium 68-20]UJB67036.1 GtrA family protein [Acidovorax sp. YS12]